MKQQQYLSLLVLFYFLVRLKYLIIKKMTAEKASKICEFCVLSHEDFFKNYPNLKVVEQIYFGFPDTVSHTIRYVDEEYLLVAEGIQIKYGGRCVSINGTHRFINIIK
jgi:hypothetical protein